jgi:hypothetical protein
MSLVFRYAAAVVVAFAASMTTMFLLATLAASLQLTSNGSVFDWIEPMIFNVLIGFAGVFAGTLCLPRTHWVSGAVVLTVLGASFEILFFMTLPGPHAGFPRGVLAAGPGGLLAAGLLYWRRGANNALQPTPNQSRGG